MLGNEVARYSLVLAASGPREIVLSVRQGSLERGRGAKDGHRGRVVAGLLQQVAVAHHTKQLRFRCETL